MHQLMHLLLLPFFLRTGWLDAMKAKTSLLLYHLLWLPAGLLPSRYAGQSAWEKCRKVLRRAAALAKEDFSQQ